jgi:UDP-N-acetylglucosamine:LPS N-acetylglucosamine transferase
LSVPCVAWPYFSGEMVSKKRILAVASGGGHWVQLLRLRGAFADHEVTFVTVNEAYQADVAPERFHVIPDATRWNKLGLLRMALRLGWILVRERPDVVISTGAAPGYFALRMGKWLGARTIWLDSAANVEKLSLSGQKVGKYADLWLTQWPQLARPEGPHFIGGVL